MGIPRPRSWVIIRTHIQRGHEVTDGAREAGDGGVIYHSDIQVGSQDEKTRYQLQGGSDTSIGYG